MNKEHIKEILKAVKFTIILFSIVFSPIIITGTYYYVCDVIEFIKEFPKNGFLIEAPIADLEEANIHDE